MSSVAFSPDGKQLATASGDKTAKIWNVESGTEVTNLRGHTASVTAVAFSPDGKVLASGSDDKTVKLWVVDSGKQVRTLVGHAGRLASVAFSPDGKLLATAFKHAGSSLQVCPVKVWTVDNGATEVMNISGHYGGVLSVAFSPDGTLLATASTDQTVRVWQLAEMRTDKIKSVGCKVALSVDGTLLATASLDNTLKLWNVENGMKVQCDSNDSFLTRLGFDKIVHSGAPTDNVNEQSESEPLDTSTKNLQFSRVVPAATWTSTFHHPVLQLGPQHPRFRNDGVVGAHRVLGNQALRSLLLGEG